ncbi:MAG TPA: FtsQ-type POTRA domain-containing protein [Polyangia bacterium]|jgi:cell division protein FtsQ
MVIAQRKRRRGLFGAPRNKRVRPKDPAGVAAATAAAGADTPADGAPAPRGPGLGARLKGAARAVVRPLRIAGKVLGALALAATLGVGGWAGYRAILTSPRFLVRDVRISPTRHLAPAEVAALVDVERGRNILSVDLGRIERDLAAQPWVLRAAVRRELPGTIVADVVEREPALLVELAGLYLADAEGRIFKRAETSETEGLTVVTGLERDTYLRERARAEAQLREVLGLLATYAAVPGRPAVGEVHVADTGYILYTQAGATAIRLGRAELAAQLHRLDVVWRALGQRQALARTIYLDNRTRPDRVTLRLDPEPGADGDEAAPASGKEN